MWRCGGVHTCDGHAQGGQAGAEASLVSSLQTHTIYIKHMRALVCAAQMGSGQMQQIAVLCHGPPVRSPDVALPHLRTAACRGWAAGSHCSLLPAIKPTLDSSVQAHSPAVVPASRRDYWENGPALSGSILVYNTGGWAQGAG